jgi:hypothetical protein
VSSCLPRGGRVVREGVIGLDGACVGRVRFGLGVCGGLGLWDGGSVLILHVSFKRNLYCLGWDYPPIRQGAEEMDAVEVIYLMGGEAPRIGLGGETMMGAGLCVGWECVEAA